MSIDLRDPPAICAAVGVASVPDVWRTTWPQSARSFVTGNVFFLQPQWVADTCRTLGFREDVGAALAEAAAQVAGRPHLERLLWHCHWLICESGLDPQIMTWPEFAAAPEPVGPMLYGLLTLSGFPHMCLVNGARGIAMADTIESLASLETWLLEFKQREGVWRFPRMGWLVHHLRGRLHKLGRLEFLPGDCGVPARFYRSTVTGKVIALAEHDALLREDGQFASADYGAVREGLWRAEFIEALGSVSGSPVSSRGHVRHEQVTLDTAEWYEILRRGDPVVTVHIPAKGPLDPVACGEAFRKAAEFYPKHFPELHFRAFTCGSWLLDPQFEMLDPPPPNLCAFLREWYLLPADGANDRGTWARVCDLVGEAAPDWEHAPQDTSLQRALAAFVRQGGHPRWAWGVIFPEDLDWGKQVYRVE